MKSFQSILLPLRYEPGPSPALKLALWFATQLKSHVHLICFGNAPRSDRELLESLGVTARRTPSACAEPKETSRTRS